MTAPTSAQWLRAAAQRLAVGSERLTASRVRAVTAWVRRTWKRTMTWLGDATGIAWCVRLAVLLAAAWLLKKVGLSVAGAAARRLEASPWLMWPALGLWIIAAWRAGNPDAAAKATPPAGAGDAPEPAGSGSAAGLTVDQLRALLAECFGADEQVHVAVLAERLTGHTHRTWTAADVRAAAETAGARVEKGVRMPGRSPSTGIRRSTLPDPSPAPPPGPVDGVVVAGQNPTTGAATATPTGPPTGPGEGGGKGFTIIDDPSNPYRHHVINH